MASHADDDLRPTATEGYKVGEKKSVDEYKKLDAEDESLTRWKESLGIGAAPVAPVDDPRKVVILELSLLIAGRPDVVINLGAPGAVEALKKKPFIIKEGSEYKMKAKFRVQHEVISGLRYLQLVKRGPLRVDKSEEMMGSYGPNTDANPFHEKIFALEEAPSGMFARGKYDAQSRFMDDDNNIHLEYSWGFEISKNWDWPAWSDT